jgi:hypothetical protein
VNPFKDLDLGSGKGWSNVGNELALSNKFASFPLAHLCQRVAELFSERCRHLTVHHLLNDTVDRDFEASS